MVFQFHKKFAELIEQSEIDRYQALSVSHLFYCDLNVLAAYWYQVYKLYKFLLWFIFWQL
jgi:hypothetical protein